MPSAYGYSRWDGTQSDFDLDPGTVLSQLTDDLLYHGDVNAALRALVRSGFRDRHGQRVQGLRELLEQLRERRRHHLARHDLGGVYHDVAQRLRDVVERERAALAAYEEAARSSGDARRREIAEGLAGTRNLELDLLPPDLAGQVRALSDYDFMSPDARAAFEQLVEELRSQLAQSWFQQLSRAMGTPSPEDLRRTKDMLAELNQMLEQRARGQEPDFGAFMSRYGDLFPEDPSTLDELLEAMARRLAALQAMLRSMTPEQRAQLQALGDHLLDDLDLRWQVDQLAAHLQAAYPGAGWDASYSFSGSEPVDLSAAMGVLGELGDLDQLEQLLTSAPNPGALAEVDLERARRLLGDDAALSLERMAEVTRALVDAGLVEQSEGRYRLSPRGTRRIGQSALAELFGRLSHDVAGHHQIPRVGLGQERAHQSRPYAFGDPFLLDIERTVRNAVARAGAGTPVELHPGDFEVAQTEALTRASTVVMLDVSLSMPMRDNFLAAKKVAMALHALIASQYPRDHLSVVAFSKVARELRPEELPQVSWDFDYGTNMQHGLMLSRRLLARQAGTRQVIMITDGEPTAHLEPGMDEPFFSYPPVRETVDATLREVNRCTRAGIRINTFMLDATEPLRAFVEKLTRLNRGRAFFTTPETLGDYVLVDFIEQRRALSRRRRGA